LLDVGCGTGFLALLLAELGHRVTGVDLADGMLAIARGKAAAIPGNAPPPAFRWGDAIDPPLPAASVDAVVNRHLLWTLTDPARAFVNWRRLLRPGGRVVAIDGLWRLGRQAEARTAPVPPGPAAQPPTEAWREVWARHYTEEVRAALPLHDAETFEPILAAATAAGLEDIRVSRLDEVDRVENEMHPDRPPRRPRYVLTAAAGPAGSTA
jgi:SAM-dependent methyltransferase